jgi:hypothetical protein
MSNFRSVGLALVLGAFVQTASAKTSVNFSDLPASAQARISEAVARDSGLAQKWVRVRLSGSDTKPNNLFGFSIAASGDTVVVASRYFGCLEGGAYVFVKPATGWQDMTQTAKLIGSDFGPCGGSGFDEVAIDGNTIVAGPGPSGQTAYVFVEPENGWQDMTETAQLTANPNLYGLTSLAISGETVAVGYPLALGNEIGATAVFVEPPGGWQDTTQTAILTASDGASGDQLGWSVAIDGETVIAGAPNAEVNGLTWAGAVYAFNQPPAGWANMTQTTKLIGNPMIGGYLGACLSMSHGTAVACASTAAEIFVQPGAQLSVVNLPFGVLEIPPNAGAYSASISGNIVVIGTGGEYPTYYGAMFAWDRPSGGWQKVSSPDFQFWGKPSGGPQLIGYSVAASGSSLIAGAPGHKNSTGVAYLFMPK